MTSRDTQPTLRSTIWRRPVVPFKSTMYFAAYDRHGNIIDAIWEWSHEEADTKLRARTPNISVTRRIR